MAKKFLVPINLAPLSSDPSSGSDGDAYFNLTTNKLRVYYNGAWNDVVSDNQAQVDEIYYLESPPESPSPGDIWIDSNSNIDTRIYFVDGENYNTELFEFKQDGGEPSTTEFSLVLDGGVP